MQSIFGSNDSTLSATQENWAIQTNIQAQPLYIKNFLDQQYWPFAITKDGKNVSGSYLYPWICCSQKQKQSLAIPSLQEQPITTFVTGMCMFGDTLIGIDEDGVSHKLTDPKYTFPEGKAIQQIQLKKGLHPYEKLIYQMLLNQIAVMKACGKANAVKIFFHLPIPEYLLYGIKWFVNNQITAEALETYFQIVHEKGVRMQQYLNGLSLLEDIAIHISSPLDGLDLVALKNQLIASNTIEYTVVNRLVEQLPSLNMPGDTVWSNILSKQDHSKLDIQTICYLSYAVHVGIANISGAAGGRVCIMDMLDEITIGREYAKYFADEFGPVLAMHWLPPVLLNDGGDNSIFMCGESYSELMSHITPSKIIENGLMVANYVQSFKVQCRLGS